MLQDIAKTKRFLSTFAPNSPITFQTFDDDKDRQDGSLARIFHGSLDKHKNRLIRLNDERAGIFFMVNEGDLQGRSTQNVTRVRCLFVDLDGTPVDPVINGPLAPHIVVRSSPGRYHAYWLTDDIELEEFKPMQKALALKFDADNSVNDLPRVMRLPGFLHRKGEPYRTRVIKSSSRPAYGRDEFLRAFNIDPTQPPKPTRKSRSNQRKAHQKLQGPPLPPKIRKKIRLALRRISAVPYDIWIKVGMALHSTGAPEAYGLWNKWSSMCPDKYDEDHQAYKWASFGGDGVGVGLPSIYELARLKGFYQRGLIRGTSPDKEARDVSVRKGQKQFRGLVRNLIRNPKNPEGKRRVMALDVTPGFGKTSLTWKELIRSGLKVEAYVPTHHLAQEIAEGLKAQYGVEACSVVGRNIGGMCEKFELVEKLNKIGVHGVYGLVCEKRKKDEDPVVCQHFNDCPYLQQHEPTPIKILTLAHLPLSRNTRDTDRPDIALVDERFIQNIIAKEEWNIAGLMRSPHKLVRDIAQLVNRGLPLIPALRKLYPDLESVVETLIQKIEKDSHDLPNVVPSMSQKAGILALSQFKQLRHSSPLNLLTTLLTALEIGAPDTRAIWCGLPDKIQGKKRGTEPVLKATWLLMPDRLKDIPILIIDGSMASDALSRLFPELEHHCIRVGRFNLGKVTQICSTAMPNRKLDPKESDTVSSKKEAKRLKNRIEKALRRINRLHPGPGLVVGKRSFMEGLKVPSGVETAHFGGVLGLNEWEHCGYVVVIGRNQPPTESMVDQARAFYGNDLVPLDTQDNLEKLPAGYQIRSGYRVGTWVQQHIDPRVQQFMRLARESESEQSIDRVRVVHKGTGEPKPVYILSNIPLDMEIDELVVLKQFLDGPSELQRAWEQLGARVMPLNHGWLHTRFPLLFNNRRHARTCIERERKYDKVPCIYTIWKNDIIQYRVNGKRGPSDSCLTRFGPKTTKRILETLVGREVVLV
ncbi:MAG: PriCT-2 domain-containing protein [Magnetococcales bacterium]|nr:PriCT-2 domain-containing protein [Magnetococcales bacterium]